MCAYRYAYFVTQKGAVLTVAPVPGMHAATPRSLAGMYARRFPADYDVECAYISHIGWKSVRSHLQPASWTVLMATDLTTKQDEVAAAHPATGMKTAVLGGLIY